MESIRCADFAELRPDFDAFVAVGASGHGSPNIRRCAHSTAARRGALVVLANPEHRSRTKMTDMLAHSSVPKLITFRSTLMRWRQEIPA